jgi:hypothetical protein
MGDISRFSEAHRELEGDIQDIEAENDHTGTGGVRRDGQLVVDTRSH